MSREDLLDYIKSRNPNPGEKRVYSRRLSGRVERTDLRQPPAPGVSNDHAAACPNGTGRTAAS